MSMPRPMRTSRLRPRRWRWLCRHRASAASRSDRSGRATDRHPSIEGGCRSFRDGDRFATSTDLRQVSRSDGDRTATDAETGPRSTAATGVMHGSTCPSDPSRTSESSARVNVVWSVFRLTGLCSSSLMAATEPVERERAAVLEGVEHPAKDGHVVAALPHLAQVAVMPGDGQRERPEARVVVVLAVLEQHLGLGPGEATRSSGRGCARTPSQTGSGGRRPW